MPLPPTITGDNVKKHSDEAEDKKLIKKMIGNHAPKKKIQKHLKEDMRESARSIKKDASLIKTMKGSRGR